MRLAVCTLSAVLLSGCSWLGYGGNSANYGGGYGAAGCDNAAMVYGNPACAPGAGSGQAGYGQAGYGQAGYGAGMNGLRGAQGGGYGYGAGMGGAAGMGAYGPGPGAGANGYGAAGYGASGYGMSTAGANGPSVSGYGANGAGMTGYGATVYGTGVTGYGAGATGYGQAGYGTGTVLGGAAPYGTAVGATNVAGGYGVNSGVTTVQGAPIYVQQPYPSYYPVGVAAGGLRGGSAALPFGLEFGVGTDFAIGGDIVGAKPAGPVMSCCGNPGNLDVSATDAIAYGDAYKNAVSYDLAATYDIDPSTTLIGRVGYASAKGERLKIGTIDDRQINPGNITTEDLYAQWGDLKQVTLEGGVRKYMGGWNNSVSGIRPYVGATAGFTHNKAVDLAQESATLMPTGANVQQYIDAGWTPTASGVLGAEMQVGPRTAIGVESGIRWSDGLNTNVDSDSRWSVPVKLRGRVSF